MKPATPGYVMIGLLSGVFAFALINVVQLNSLEKRVSTQAKQIRVLGEANERIAGQMKRIQSGGARESAADDECEIDKVLHPEVKNFLGRRDKNWPPEGATTNGVFKLGWSSGDPKGFNPIIENAAELSDYIKHYVASPIADRNRWTDPNTWYGQTACRVEVTDDYKEYTIYLRKGIKWHKPSGVDLKNPRYKWLDQEHELTADDYVFTYEMIMNPQVANGNQKVYFQDIDYVKAVDKYTLVVRWKRKLFHSLEVTLWEDFTVIPKFIFGYSEDGKPIPKETLGLRLNQHWYNNKGFVGFGPYRMAEYKPGSHITLERNEDFFGEKPAIKKIVYPIYTDRTVGLLKIKSGELNFVVLRPGQYREEILDWQSKPKQTWPKNDPFLNGDIQCQPEPMLGYYYIGWNADKPLFKDKRVRRAMTYAFNRQEIIDKVFVGLGKIVTGNIMPWTGDADPTIKPYPFDLEQSKKLLAEAGWTDTDGDGLVDKVVEGKRTPFEFTLLIYGSSPEYNSLANIFKEDLLKVGVKMSISSVEWSLMQKRMDERNFDAFTGAWAMSWESDPYQIWHSSQADAPKGSNKVGFRNEEADKLIEQLRVTFDRGKRREMLRAFHRIVHEEQPYSFFMIREVPYCWRKDVKGVVFSKVRPKNDFFPWWVTSTQ